MLSNLEMQTRYVRVVDKQLEKMERLRNDYQMIQEMKVLEGMIKVGRRLCLVKESVAAEILDIIYEND